MLTISNILVYIYFFLVFDFIVSIHPDEPCIFNSLDNAVCLPLHVSYLKEKHNFLIFVLFEMKNEFNDVTKK